MGLGGADFGISLDLPKRGRRLALVGLVLSGHLLGCSNSQEGALLTDAIPLTECPKSSCAQGVADIAETKLVLQTPISLVVPDQSSFAEVAGDCYVSLFPNSRFEVTVSLNGTVQNGVLPQGLVPRCMNGKFYFPINLEGRPAGTYLLSAPLVIIDAQGVEHRPPFKTVNTTIIKRQ